MLFIDYKTKKHKLFRIELTVNDQRNADKAEEACAR